jgi:hypothetical protein
MNNDELDIVLRNLENQIRLLRINHEAEVRALNTTLNDLRRNRTDNDVRTGNEQEEDDATVANIQRARIIPQEPRRRQQARRPGHNVGDTVRIVNNYQGLFGVQGVVVDVTRYRVSVRLPIHNGHARIIKRAHHNVELVVM